MIKKAIASMVRWLICIILIVLWVGSIARGQSGGDFSLDTIDLMR